MRRSSSKRGFLKTSESISKAPSSDVIVPEVLKQKIHFRRCHICLTVQCKENGLVERCTSCGKYLRTFIFFDENNALGLTIPINNSKKKSNSKSTQKSAKESIKESSLESMKSSKKVTFERRSVLKTHYPPPKGLTVYWSEE